MLIVKDAERVWNGARENKWEFTVLSFQIFCYLISALKYLKEKISDAQSLLQINCIN
jgi:hypothetical protein